MYCNQDLSEVQELEHLNKEDYSKEVIMRVKNLPYNIFIAFLLLLFATSKQSLSATKSRKIELAEKLLVWLEKFEKEPIVGSFDTNESTSFEVITKIGDGNFGGVFYIKVNEAHFAVKHFSEGRREEDIKTRESFIQTSPFFLKQYAQNKFYEVQELGGQNLENLLRPIRFVAKVRHMIFLRILLAVKTLHAHNFTHYDIKWSNIVLERKQAKLKEASIKLIDLDDMGPETNQGKVGTNFYMSAARQIATDEADFWYENLKITLGPADDIYSLGIMLLEVLCEPFAAKEKKCYQILLEKCCRVQAKGLSYKELLDLEPHERFRKKTNHNESYISSRKTMYNDLIEKIQNGEITNPEIIVAAKAINPKAEKRPSIDEFLIEWLEIIASTL